MATIGQILAQNLIRDLSDLERDLAHLQWLKLQVNQDPRVKALRQQKLDRQIGKMDLKIMEKKALAEMVLTQSHLPEIKELHRRLDIVLKVLWDLLTDPSSKEDLLSEQVRDMQTMKQQIMAVRGTLSDGGHTGQVIHAPLPVHPGPTSDPVTAMLLGLAIVFDFLRGWKSRGK